MAELKGWDCFWWDGGGGWGGQMGMRWGPDGPSEEPNLFIPKMLDCGAGWCSQMDSSEVVWSIISLTF